MKITDVKVHIIESPVEYGVDNETGEAYATRRTCLFVVRTDEGLTGYSQIESQPDVVRAAVVAPGEASGVFSGLRSLAVGEDPLQVEALWDRLFRGSYYYGRRGAALQAISGIDIACWDIIGKATNLPVATLLGGVRRTRVRAYASTLFRDDPAAMRETAHRYIDQGFTAMKFGWGSFGDDLKSDLALVEAARSAIGGERDLMIDAGWRQRNTAKDAITLVRALEEYFPYWVEEPCFPEDYSTLRRLAEAVQTRIAAGEAEATIWGFRDLAERGGVDVLQPDISRCGGLTVARRVAHLADDLNLLVCPHAWGSELLTAATLHFLAFLPRESLLEFNTSADPISRELVLEPLKLVDGFAALPSGPGLGVEPDLERVHSLEVAIV